MGQHHALRFTGRARGINDGRKVGRLDLGQCPVDRVSVDLVILVALGFDLVQRQRTAVPFGFTVIVKKDQFFEPLDALYGILAVFPELFARNEQYLCTGIFEDESDLLDGLRRVDRNIYSSQTEYGKVDE